MEKLTLSVSEAADMLGVSKTTMYQLVKTEGFPLITVGRRLLISAKGLARWVEEHTGAQGSVVNERMML